MFTFGRRHELVCATKYVRGSKNTELAEKTVNAIHDFLEQRITESDLLSVLRTAFRDGGLGVWEQAANWLRRLAIQYPELLQLWLEFAQDSSSKVRFRAACCLPDMTPEYAHQISALLIVDISSKVREMAFAKQ